MTEKEVDFFLLGLEIQARIQELHELTRTIKEIDEELVKDPSEDNKLYFEETVERYKSVVNKARIQLEAYFKEEENAGLPTDFLFRKLYKKLKDAY